jgi:hypothetical protein
VYDDEDGRRGSEFRRYAIEKGEWKQAEAQAGDGDKRNELIPLVERPNQASIFGWTRPNEKKVQKKGQRKLFGGLVVSSIKQHVRESYYSLHEPSVRVSAE